MSTLLLSTVGCGSEKPLTYPVQGTVSLDGTAISRGSIEFKPLSGANHAAAAPVVDGAYTVRLPPGSYRAEILASRTDPEKRDALGMPLVEQYIPAKYNRDSELTMEVTAGARKQDWELSSEE